MYMYIIYPTSHGIPCCSRTVSAFGLKLHLRLRKARQTVAHPPCQRWPKALWPQMICFGNPKNVGCCFCFEKYMGSIMDLYSKKRILQKKTWQDCWKFENL